MYSYSFFTNLASAGPFAAYPGIDLKSNFDRFSYDTISVEYTVKDWVFASEWQRSGGVITYSAPPILPTVTGDTGWDGWYVSAARRLSDKFEVGAYYGSLKDRFTSIPGSNPASHQDDTAVSFRYDLNDHVIFKIEAHYIDGTYQTFNTVRTPNPAPQGRHHALRRQVHDQLLIPLKQESIRHEHQPSAPPWRAPPPWNLGDRRGRRARHHRQQEP